MSGDDYAAFMGMYLAEGCASWPSDPYAVIISQEKQSKGYTAYRDLLIRIFGSEPHYGGNRWALSRKALALHLAPLGHAESKFIPDGLLGASRRQLEIFWRFYHLGDGFGSDAKGDNQRCVTVSERLADDLQEVAQKIGYWSRISVRKGRPNFWGGHDTRQSYVLGLRRTMFVQTNVDSVPYSGRVGCVQVPNGVIYVRRNGTPSWCGNCHVQVIPHETDVDINASKPRVKNPDNPKGKYTETSAWFHVDHIADNPAVRDEVRKTADTWKPVVEMAQSIDEAGGRSLPAFEDFDAFSQRLEALVS